MLNTLYCIVAKIQMIKLLKQLQLCYRVHVRTSTGHVHVVPVPAKMKRNPPLPFALPRALLYKIYCSGMYTVRVMP